MSDSFFPVFGKIVFVLVILGFVGGVSYYLGKTLPIQQQQAKIPSPTPSPALNSPAPSLAPSPVVQIQTIDGGSTDFTLYTLQAQVLWKVTKTENAGIGSNELRLENGEYALKIRQVARGGSPCAFKDAPIEVTNPELSAPGVYETYIEIPGSNGAKFRRVEVVTNPNPGGVPPGKKFYTICQKSPTENAYWDPTTFGEITYEAPLNNSQVSLRELDGILASLKKK